ncbi:MAG TPA: sporulation initiation factor Spo0A [Ruminococcaceae bacterium]|nr:sporulation initiation factor Spo0A [Oscillospiraceae bacterium]
MKNMEIQIVLRRLGICSTYKGYKATVLALTLALEDENRLNSITKNIYSEVARQLGSTPSAVERNMRTVVQRAWKINPADLERMAGYHIEYLPSVSEFLDILFNYIQRSRLSKDK